MDVFTGLLVMMFFLVFGVAFIGGFLFILLDVLLQSTDDDGRGF